MRAHGAPADEEGADEEEEKEEEEEEEERKEELPGRSALSVADAVVTEYEKLLAAIPTMARHMGKLQLDTESMAEGERGMASFGDLVLSVRSCLLRRCS